MTSSHLAGERPISSERYEVTPIECVAVTDYWRGLAAHWDSAETIINVEHDMEYSDKLASDLLDCSEPLCTHAYRVYIERLREWHWAAWDDRFVYVRADAQHASNASIGFCKIAPSARVAPLGRTTWKLLELEVNRSVRGPWHIHWPAVKHHHRYGDPLAELFQTTGIAGDSTGGFFTRRDPCRLLPPP